MEKSTAIVIDSKSMKSEKLSIEVVCKFLRLRLALDFVSWPVNFLTQSAAIEHAAIQATGITPLHAVFALSDLLGKLVYSILV